MKRNTIPILAFHRHWLVLGGMLAFALILRLWGINYGLPFSYHYDEGVYTGAALNLGAGRIGPQQNPTGFTNLLFGEYILYFLLGRLTGIFPSVESFAQAYRTEPGMFFLLARLTTAFFGVLNLLVLYKLGKEIHSRATGALSALFLAVAFLHVRDSHFGVPDITATFFVSLSILFCVLLLKQNSRWHLSLAAITAGFAIATKWTVWPVLACLLITIAFRWRSSTGLTSRGVMIKTELLPGLLFFAAGFLVGGFQLFLRPSLYFGSALEELKSGGAGGFWFWQVDTLPGWLFYLNTMIAGMGLLLTTLAILGWIAKVFSVWRTKDQKGVLLLTFPIIYFAIMGATRHYFARYLLPLIPFLLLFAAEFLISLATFFAGSQRKLAWLGTAILVTISVLPMIVSDMRLNYLLTQVDTRTLAHQWIEQNIPEGDYIAVDWTIHTPYLATAEDPAPASRNIYQVISFDDSAGLFEKPVGWYRENGVDYLIATSYIYRIPLVDVQSNQARIAFYQSLDREFELIQEFRPYEGNREPAFVFDEIYASLVSLWQRERPGPTLKIYRVTGK